MKQIKNNSVGVNFKPAHMDHLLNHAHLIDWLEIHAENYFFTQNSLFADLKKIGAHFPISIHGVGLSLGSASPLNFTHLKQLKELIQRVQPIFFSEHLSWSSIDGIYLPDLFPLPFDDATLAHCVQRIQVVQDYLGQSILIENIARYVNFTQSHLSEPDFLNEICAQAGCKLLLDLSNLYINAHNFNFSWQDFLKKIHPSCVNEIHLGGFTEKKFSDENLKIDTHDCAIDPFVFEILKCSKKYFGPKPTLIEWDKNIPPFTILKAEVIKVQQINQ